MFQSHHNTCFFCTHDLIQHKKPRPNIPKVSCRFVGGFASPCLVLKNEAVTFVKSVLTGIKSMKKLSWKNWMVLQCSLQSYHAFSIVSHSKAKSAAYFRRKHPSCCVYHRLHIPPTRYCVYYLEKIP